MKATEDWIRMSEDAGPFKAALIKQRDDILQKLDELPLWNLWKRWVLHEELYRVRRALKHLYGCE